MKRFQFASIGISLLISGCTSDSHMAYQTIHDAFVAPPNASISAQQLAQLPYAASYIQMRDASRALVILAKAKGDERMWVSHQKEAVVTRFGRIIRTDGLKPANIKGVHFVDGDPLRHGLTSLKLQHYQAKGYIDLMPDYQYGLPFTARYVVKGMASKMIGGHVIQLTEVDEYYELPQLGFHTVNKYWLSSRGLVRQSEQQLSPTLPPFKMTLLKPYQQDLQ
ncbi:YjbF family lipoprotein [Celerinatantimonas yamalensis]|uniref:YjbF family lipoprotein n=1 Tax=Celerinatantimonas yamalensis TaxID=559956 RepID=A0ABW9G4L5_9GAMM